LNGFPQPAKVAVSECALASLLEAISPTRNLPAENGGAGLVAIRFVELMEG
jgi:hypothetical protein